MSPKNSSINLLQFAYHQKRQNSKGTKLNLRLTCMQISDNALQLTFISMIHLKDRSGTEQSNGAE